MSNLIYNDDEPIRKIDSQDEEEADLDLDGKTEAKIINKQEAPLEECLFKVLLELEGVGTDEGRLGVDLVTILDISGSMSGTKLAKMKLAMQFLVQKLSRADRLSVVTFNSNAHKLCPLRQITEDSKTEIANQVNELVAQYTTNTEAGLKMALKILNDRTRSKRRGVAIMLMSDGMEDKSSHAASVPVGHVPVYTFGFGTDCDPKVLSDISRQSNGGMFAAVPVLDNLSVAFSTSLAGLLNVAIEDLILTIAPENGSQFSEVNAGNYAQMKGATLVDPVAVTFGTLYNRETRKVLVKLTLPKVDKRLGVNIYKVVYKYRVAGQDAFNSEERTMNITRKAMPNEAERQEVLDEEKRIGTASSIKAARILADAKKLEMAREKLVDAKASLSEIDAILTAQLNQLLLFMVSQETYDKQGKAFALALEASHESQRATTLPGGVAGMFNTPLMDEFIKQAGLFNQDPINYQVPTPEEDKVTIASVAPTREPPKQEDWRYARFKQVIDLTHSIAEKLREHDPRAAFTGKK